MTEETLKKANEIHTEILDIERCYRDIGFPGLDNRFVDVSVMGIAIKLPESDRLSIVNIVKVHLEKRLTNLKQQLAEL